MYWLRASQYPCIRCCVKCFFPFVVDFIQIEEKGGKLETISFLEPDRYWQRLVYFTVNICGQVMFSVFSFFSFLFLFTYGQIALSMSSLGKTRLLSQTEFWEVICFFDLFSFPSSFFSFYFFYFPFLLIWFFTGSGMNSKRTFYAFAAQ